MRPRLGPSTQVWETSHTGGHRFAPDVRLAARRLPLRRARRRVAQPRRLPRSVVPAADERRRPSSRCCATSGRARRVPSTHALSRTALAGHGRRRELRWRRQRAGSTDLVMRRSRGPPLGSRTVTPGSVHCGPRPQPRVVSARHAVPLASFTRRSCAEPTRSTRSSVTSDRSRPMGSSVTTSVTVGSYGAAGSVVRLNLASRERSSCSPRPPSRRAIDVAYVDGFRRSDHATDPRSAHRRRSELLGTLHRSRHASFDGRSRPGISTSRESMPENTSPRRGGRAPRTLDRRQPGRRPSRYRRA